MTEKVAVTENEYKSALSFSGADLIIRWTFTYK